MYNVLSSVSVERPDFILASRKGPDGHSSPRRIESIGGTVMYTRDVEIFGESEPADYFCKVVSGAVRTYTVLADGRRQVCAFYLRGDFFGLEANETRTSSADSIVDSKLLVIKRSVAMTLAQTDEEIARQIWTIWDKELQISRAHGSLLTKNAKERVAAFLLEMADRFSGTDQVELPMSRRDIADYLGVTIETISRMLADLEGHGAISLAGWRRVLLRNRRVLGQLCLREA
jgi:CRP/FNR family nitrogen fixation transcriptional regulator